MTELKNTLIIDATNATVGRLASYAAKQSLLGKSVIIVNCKYAVVTGRPKSIISEFQEARTRGGSSLNGPFYPKQPQKIVKRMVRGMLPYKQLRGREALKRVMCYDLVPAQYEKSEKIHAGKEKNVDTITLEDLSREI